VYILDIVSKFSVGIIKFYHEGVLLLRNSKRLRNGSLASSRTSV